MDGFYSGGTLIPASAPAIPSPVPEGLAVKRGAEIEGRRRLGFDTWIEGRFTESDAS
jgi:hypothetical protein